MNTEYKLSGKPGKIYLIGLILGPPIIFVLFYLIALINYYFNFSIICSALAFIGYLIAVGVAHAMVYRWSKCRSLLHSRIIGVFLGITAAYLNWVSFLYLLMTDDHSISDLLFLITHPNDVFQLIDVLSVQEESRGYFLWTLEAISIVGAGFAAGKVNSSETVFCEGCKKWADDITLDLDLEIPEEQKEGYTLYTDLKQFLNFPFADSSKEQFLRFNAHQCSTCKETITLNIDLINRSIDNKGKIKENNDDFSPVYVINESELLQFISKKNTTLKNMEPHSAID